MPLHLVVAKPDLALTKLPWDVPLTEWGDDVLVPLPRGLSRHVVRVVRAADCFVAVKETQEALAYREYRLLRRLNGLRLPAVEAHGVVTGRTDRDGDPLDAVLMTVHLTYSLPYRVLVAQGLSGDGLLGLVDALVVLLVRLHLAGFFWGDVSLSNVLFRRSAGEFAAYVVDAETGELHESLSDGQRRHDLEIATTNVFGELLDLQAGGTLSPEVDPGDIIDNLQRRYDALWAELTRTEEFAIQELWRIEQRIDRVNELGFDVEELDLATSEDGTAMRLRPRVVEAGHHSRELQDRTGLVVEENQARRLLTDLASFTTHYGLTHDDAKVVGHRWLTQIFAPVTAMVPEKDRGKLSSAELFHEILEHRWLLSERAGHEVDLFDTAADYLDTVLAHRPRAPTSPVASEDAAPR